jgi:hypothetical protein
MFRDFYAPAESVGAISRFLAAPIDIRSRREKENQLSDAKKDT